MPIGLFLTKNSNGTEHFEDCNDTFAIVNGYLSAKDLRGKKASVIHKSNSDYTNLIEKFKAVAGPWSEKIKISRGGKLLEIFNKPFYNRGGGIGGRVGAAMDVTDEEANREWLSVISRYIGNVLHTNQSSLLSLDSTLEAMAEYFGERSKKLLPFNAEEAAKVIAVKSRPVAAALEKLLRTKDENPEMQIAFGDGGWKKLENCLREISGDLEDSTNSKYALMREAGLGIVGVMKLDKNKILPSGLRAEVLSTADDMLRVAFTHTFRLARSRVTEMAMEVKNLRDAVVSRSVGSTQRSVVELNSLVPSVLAEYYDYARSKGVELRFQGWDKTLKVKAIERDLYRALGNLIHNAIKYSWSKRDFVHVQTSLWCDGDEAVVEIENWGVGILAAEIDRVFIDGFRGLISGDRRRTGTGLGLADAKRVLESSAGSIQITSTAAGDSGRPVAERPHVTRVRLRLPIAA